MNVIFGSFHDVDIVQQCLRAALIFFYGLVFLRLTGRRSFAQWSPLDFIMSVIVGSSLGRTLTGDAPLWGTLVAVAVLAALHWGVAFAVARNEWLSRWIEGGEVVLAEGGVLDERARRRHNISHADLSEAMRQSGLDGIGALSATRRITLEPNGRITVLKT